MPGDDDGLPEPEPEPEYSSKISRWESNKRWKQDADAVSRAAAAARSAAADGGGEAAAATPAPRSGDSAPATEVAEAHECEPVEAVPPPVFGSPPSVPHDPPLDGYDCAVSRGRGEGR